VADRIGRRPVAIIAFAWVVVISSLVGFSPNTVVFFLAFAAVGTASGSSGVIPAALLGDVAADQTTGTAVGIFRFAGDVGMTLGPFVAGVTATALGFPAAFAVSVAPCFVVVVMMARMPETLKR
jgi:MFS family permease